MNKYIKNKNKYNTLKIFKNNYHNGGGDDINVIVNGKNYVCKNSDRTRYYNIQNNDAYEYYIYDIKGMKLDQISKEKINNYEYIALCEKIDDENVTYDEYISNVSKLDITKKTEILEGNYDAIKIAIAKIPQIDNTDPMYDMVAEMLKEYVNSTILVLGNDIDNIDPAMRDLLSSLNDQYINE